MPIKKPNARLDVLLLLEGKLAFAYMDAPNIVEVTRGNITPINKYKFEIPLLDTNANYCIRLNNLSKPQISSKFSSII
jgi:hypothetical protein